MAFKDNNGKKEAILTEPQYPDSSITISGLPDNIIIIKADTFKSPDTVFAGSKGECKRADFVIIADTNDKKIIMCIEIKATKKLEWEILQQLKGAQCFIYYCREIGRTFWKKEEFLKNYMYRFISIGHTSIPKQKTRPSVEPIDHDNPRALVKIISGRHIQFNRLIRMKRK